MNDLERMNEAMDYIEAHLEASLDEAALSRILAFPAGLFQRMFPILTGMPLSEYIRRRRLTLAAFELQATPVRLIDLALRYGYESADAFTVAFRRLHGVVPSAVRSRTVTLKSYPRLRFTMSIQGGTEMNYQLIEMPAFHVIGQSIVTTQGNSDIPVFWTRSNRDGTSERICRFSNSDAAGGETDGRAAGTASREIANGGRETANGGRETVNGGRKTAGPGSLAGAMLGVCHAVQDDGSFRYMIGIETGADEAAAAAAGLELIGIPAGSWLVFESTGAMPDAIQSVWRRIFAEFLPGSIYRHAGTPDLEVYPEGDPQSDTYSCAVWIPVVKK